MNAAHVVPLGSALVQLERTFTYLVPEDIRVEVGSVVKVPFHGRRVSGVVVGLLPEPDVARAAPIHSLYGPSVGSELVELARWLAGRTLSTFGEALAMVVPARVAAAESAERQAARLIAEVEASVPEALSAAVAAGHGAVWRPKRGEDRGAVIASLASEIARGGGDVVICVPEPASSPVAQAMRAVFGRALADLSSERGQRARYSDWLAVREGRKRIVLGGRAAVFAPVTKLRLIVLDDEGHTAYKEARAPRYHARAVAAERARRAQASCVLVGLPPSVEASAAAKIGYVSVGGAKDARLPVTVVESPGRVVPSSTTLREVAGVLAAGERALVLSHRLPLDQVAERAIRITRPSAPAVVDARTPRADVVRALADADLIVATPVVASDGAPAVTRIVAICGADAVLSRAEFRASEETFSTWWRVCANLQPGARVLIETEHPRHPAIEALVHDDPGRLLRTEAARRADLGYPPFGVLARIDVPSVRASEVADAVRAAGDGLEILGPVVEEDRAVIAVRAPRRELLLAALGPLASAWRAADEPMRIDVDPWEVFVPRWRSSRSSS